MFGNPDGLENQLNQISKVTAEQVNQVFNKYFVTDQEFWLACVAPECEEEPEAILR